MQGDTLLTTSIPASGTRELCRGNSVAEAGESLWHWNFSLCLSLVSAEALDRRAASPPSLRKTPVLKMIQLEVEGPYLLAFALALCTFCTSPQVSLFLNLKLMCPHKEGPEGWTVGAPCWSSRVPHLFHLLSALFFRTPLQSLYILE